MESLKKAEGRIARKAVSITMKVNYNSSYTLIDKNIFQSSKSESWINKSMNIAIIIVLHEINYSF